jgi:hypothetical protein
MQVSKLAGGVVGSMVFGAAMLGASGCASYATPGRAADLRAVGVSQAMVAGGTESGIEQQLNKKPLASLPTGIAVARLQAPGYRSATAQGFGDGRYSVVTTRDVEPDAAVARLTKLPMVIGIAPINRLLLPAQLQSDQELRHAAAQLHADMLLVYTLDTTFQKSDLAEPLTLITLGISPNQKATIVSTASAVLMDTRNGYIYGVSEATSRSTKLMGAWGSEGAIDESRRATEAEAFGKLVGEIEKMWGGVVKQFPSHSDAN